MPSYRSARALAGIAALAALLCAVFLWGTARECAEGEDSEALGSLGAKQPDELVEARQAVPNPGRDGSTGVLAGTGRAVSAVVLAFESASGLVALSAGREDGLTVGTVLLVAGAEGAGASVRVVEVGPRQSMGRGPEGAEPAALRPGTVLHGRAAPDGASAAGEAPATSPPRHSRRRPDASSRRSSPR